MRAIEDVFATYDPAEIVIATHPRARSHWLERDLVGRVLRRFRRPVVHVVVKERGRLEAGAANYGCDTGRTADVAAGART